jgi:hypothetical protein
MKNAILQAENFLFEVGVAVDELQIGARRTIQRLQKTLIVMAGRSDGESACERTAAIKH